MARSKSKFSVRIICPNCGSHSTAYISLTIAQETFLGAKSGYRTGFKVESNALNQHSCPRCKTPMRLDVRDNVLTIHYPKRVEWSTEDAAVESPQKEPRKRVARRSPNSIPETL